ncbi:hypothetical protein A6E27_23005 [Bacillus cereus]|nr:hypothetical protein A6E27_23005 [Bacillus cereus]
MSKIIELLWKGKTYELIIDKNLDLPNKPFRDHQGYVRMSVNGKKVMFHRWVLGTTDPNIIVDHRNRNKLDNRRSNLRECTKQENNRNSKAKGYCYLKRLNKYQANIRVDGKLIYLGIHEREEDAREAYIQASIKYFGEFSPYYKYDQGNTEEVN